MPRFVGANERLWHRVPAMIKRARTHCRRKQPPGPLRLAISPSGGDTYAWCAAAARGQRRVTRPTHTSNRQPARQLRSAVSGSWSMSASSRGKSGAVSKDRVNTPPCTSLYRPAIRMVSSTKISARGEIGSSPVRYGHKSTASTPGSLRCSSRVVGGVPEMGTGAGVGNPQVAAARVSDRAGGGHG